MVTQRITLSTSYKNFFY